MNRPRIRKRTLAFFLLVWVYLTYIFGVLRTESIPWFFIGKKYLTANWEWYQVPYGSAIPTFAGSLPKTMPFFERGLITGEYVVLNNSVVPEAILVALVVFAIYLASSKLLNIQLRKKAILQ